MAPRRRQVSQKHRRTVLSTPSANTIPIRRIAGYLLILFFLAGLLVLWFSHFLRVNVVSVQGVESLSVETLQGRVTELTQGNIFLVDQANIRQKLITEFPLIAEVGITRKFFPNTLEVIIEEKKPLITWHTGNGIFGVDAEGMVTGIALDTELIPVYAFGAVPAQDSDSPEEATLETAPEAEVSKSTLLEPGKRVATSEYIGYIVELNRRYAEELEDPILYFSEGEHHDLSIVLESGIRVLFTTDYTIESEIRRLKDTLAESQTQGKAITSHVDLRFEKVYFN